MTGLLNPKSSEMRHFLHDSRRVPRPCDYSPGVADLVFSKSVYGEVLTSKTEGTSEKEWCTSILARVVGILECCISFTF